MMRSLLLGLLFLLPALPARADNDFGATRPFGLAKVGLGLPGTPGFALELLVGNRWSVEVEGGNGLLGAYGSVGGRFRPCWGCDEGAGFALGLGPELTVIPNGEAARTGIYLTAVVEPAFVYRFADYFGFTLGFKAGFGSGLDWETADDGTRTYYGPELSNVFLFYTGVQF